MRTPHKVPKGKLNREQAARFLGVSPATFLRRVKKYGVISTVEKSVHLYQAEDIERLAQMGEGDG